MNLVLQEARAALWIVAPIIVVLGVCELLYHRLRVSAEHTRKLAHVGSGLAVIAFPWLVTSVWTVVALAVGFGVMMTASRPLGLLPSVHSVERRTRGAHYYPLAVLTTYILTQGEPAIYVIAILVMALSDTGAAIVGRRHAIARYHVIDEDYRSLGGSLALFGLTFGIVLIGLALRGGLTLPTVLAVSLVTAIVATAVEGVSVRGLDNLLLPYATVLVLQDTLGGGEEALAAWTLGAAISLALLLTTRPRVRLRTSGLMALFLAGVLAWALGGPIWFATLSVPYIVFVASRWLVGARYDLDLRRVAPAFVISIAMLLIHDHTHMPALFLPFLASVAAAAALAWARFARHRSDSTTLLLLAPVVGAGLALLPALVAHAPIPIGPAEAMFVVACALAAPAIGTLRGSIPEPAFAGVVASTAASFMWILV